MSVVTDMVLITRFAEHPSVERLNAWCHTNDGRQQQFTRLDEDAAGGIKVFTSETWAMAGNHFPWSDLAAALPTFGWRWPKEVVLIVNYEHDEETHVFRGDGRRAAGEPAEQSEPASDAATVHRAPADGIGNMPCCGLTPFEVPRTDRFAATGMFVTCGAAEAEEAHRD
jgi:hypothetical protein